MAVVIVAFLSALLLSACTLIYIEGNSNTLTDSGNHSGSLNLPQPSATRAKLLPQTQAR
ncbi:hypothetical protein [Caballeronia zhejiangensis]|uniref:hypothetical protein n=1 Tax=Caballeronia zhejiangensis TaxID=871203 RepID=UPI000A993CBE|nr:hypothetical protein [Caballeronia zhejiangensis]